MNAAILSISDTRDEDNDASGDLLVGLLTEFGATVIGKAIVSDDTDNISDALRELSDTSKVDLIVTTGGTGFGPRDNTPEATKAVIEREAPGIVEAMRRETARHTPMAMLSRGVCGIRGSTLILNFPGSPKGVSECFEVVKPVLHHAIDVINGRIEHRTDEKATRE